MKTRSLAPVLALCLALACLPLAGCGPVTFAIGYATGEQHLQTQVVEQEGAWHYNRVAIVDVTGMIMDANKPGLLRQGENPVSLLQENLQAAADDDQVKAVILRINSPGGAVTASDIMYREVMRFKRKTHKPVVVLMADVAASGGYYLACSGDQIVAYPTTITGSIGVILQTFSLKPMLDHWGITTDAIVSGPNKEAGSPLSVMTPDQRQILQDLVKQFYARFVEVVKKSRPNIRPDQFATVTDGRVFGGTQALAVGLVDHVGDLHDAFALAKKLAHVKKADLILYHRPLEYVGSAYAQTPAAPAAGAQFNLAQINIDDLDILGQTPGFYYLWRPQFP